ncbi:hypothetical protein BN8_03096 [Fibrisoma limi BUZ 3]|uniref:GAF domain-containing protein n=1 Tax=Fibrisoma limi BUZ 3 TaxID=1185876 RepID=I2GJ85_9BACT|nr:GAF domain-containing protein [Fibrisoma limi]CCH53960.1 hypothetical protein BN8_03096 [Fibrisoma limi BUZ 3]
MIKPSIPANEMARRQAVSEYDLIDTLPEEEYDAITRVATEICRTPISLITIIGDDRAWLKSRQRLNAQEAPRDIVFCSYAINDPDTIMVVNDTREDVRFKDNPLVVDGPKIAFYAGVPLVNPEGYALGTICVLDHRPRQLTDSQLLSLKALGKWVMTSFELRKTRIELASWRKSLQQVRYTTLVTTPTRPETALDATGVVQQAKALQTALNAWLSANNEAGTDQ